MRRIQLKVDMETMPREQMHWRYRVWIGGADYARFVSRRSASHWARSASDELTFRYHEAGFIYRELADLSRSVWMLADTRTRITPGMFMAIDKELAELAGDLDRVTAGNYTADPVTRLLSWYQRADRSTLLLYPVFRYRSDVERGYQIRSLGTRIEASANAIQKLKIEKTGFSFQTIKKV